MRYTGPIGIDIDIRNCRRAIHNHFAHTFAVLHCRRGVR